MINKYATKCPKRVKGGNVYFKLFMSRTASHAVRVRSSQRSCQGKRAEAQAEGS